MPTRNTEPDLYSWRRKQLSEMDQSKINSIVATPIGTAAAIVRRIPNPSPELRALAAKALINAMGSVAGYKGAPMRRMGNLLARLTTPSYPAITNLKLPEPNAAEELIEFATEAIKHFPSMTSAATQAIAHTLLTKLDELGIPSENQALHKFLVRNAPDYVPPPEFSAQFIEHKTLTQQLTEIDREARYRWAVKRAQELFNAKPEGHA